jgi:hypothetical protein
MACKVSQIRDEESQNSSLRRQLKLALPKAMINCSFRDGTFIITTNGSSLAGNGAVAGAFNLALNKGDVGNNASSGKHGSSSSSGHTRRIVRGTTAFCISPLRINHPEEERAIGLINGHDELVG